MTGTTARVIPGRRLTAISRWLPAGLALVADAAWITAAAAFLQELVLREPVLGLPHFVAAAATGLLGAVILARRLPERWPAIGIGLVVLGCLVGLAASAEIREALAAGVLEPGRILEPNPGGLLLGLAVLRGMAHAQLPLAEDRLATLLGVGTMVLTIVAAIGSLVAEPHRSRFEAEALRDTVVFAGSAIVAIALTRLSNVGSESGADWPRNPVWVATIIGLVVVIEAVGVVAADSIGVAMEMLVGIAIGPVFVLGLLFGWRRELLVRAAAFLSVAIGIRLVMLLLDLVGQHDTARPGTGPGDLGPAATDANGLPAWLNVAPVWIGLLIGLAVVVALGLIRAWAGSPRLADTDVDETRTIDRGGDDEPPRAAGRRARRRVAAATPTDAASAYRRLVAELDGRPGLAREAGETPREHARRLRLDGSGHLSLELLAADYALSEFASTALPPAEHRRAVGRWRALRSELGRVAASVEARPATAGDRLGLGRDLDDLPARRLPGDDPEG